MREIKIVKTRKQHRCAACGYIIPKNFKAECNKGLWEGEFQYYHLCEICIAFFEKYRDKLDLIDGFTDDELQNGLDYFLDLSLIDINYIKNEIIFEKYIADKKVEISMKIDNFIEKYFAKR